MPKPYTFPKIIDEMRTVSISVLKKNGYLNPNQSQSGTVSWSCNGNSTGSISIIVNTHSHPAYIELNYNCNGTPIKYRVKIISVPSNLGKGVVWFFICPHTGKRCRKLYLADTYFLHREAFGGCFYSKQVQSKFWQHLDNTVLGREFKAESLYEKIYSKHFKTHYAGKPTKKYLQLIERINILAPHFLTD
jgi:hypothetical protein